MAEVFTAEEIVGSGRSESWLARVVAEIMGDAFKVGDPLFPLTVEVKLNGKEVSFRRLVDLMLKQYNEQVHKHARDLIQQKCRDIMDQLYAVEAAAEDIVSRHVDPELADGPEEDYVRSPRTL